MSARWAAARRDKQARFKSCREAPLLPGKSRETSEGESSLNDWFKVSIREYLVSIIEERDRLYDMRFKASETAVNAALAAQEKAVTAAFTASEKAIVKAEDAQKDYNNRSNEFRGQLD